MQIDVTLTADDTHPQAVAHKTAIVIDVLRATSTIVTAVANGCMAIVPVASPEEAFITLATQKDKNFLLGGEGLGTKVQGFQLGNSPYEYSIDKVKEKTIIFTTTNGTKAIKKSAPAQETLVGSLLNARATAKTALQSGRDLIIICAGTRGRFSLEDTVAAGLIIDLIKKDCCALTMSDTARMAHRIFMHYRCFLIYPLQNSTNGRNLTKLGFARDIHFCAQLNKYDLVPRYMSGLITAK